MNVDSTDARARGAAADGGADGADAAAHESNTAARSAMAASGALMGE